MGASAVEAMMQDFKKPDNKGSTIMARYVINEGTVVQSLRNTVGPVALWAFSSTREDTILRDRLYREFGPVATRRVLARMYPGGTVKKNVFRAFSRISWPCLIR